MRTGFAKHAEPALRVAESDEVFAQQAKPDRRSVWFAQLLAERCGYPMAAHQAPHGSIPLNPAQQVVFRRRQHRKMLCPLDAAAGKCTGTAAETLVS